MPRRFLLVVALLICAGVGRPQSAQAQWTVRGVDDPTAQRVEAIGRSTNGIGSLFLGCNTDGSLYAALELVGVTSQAERLRVRYQVDALNEIESRWPITPASDSIKIYTTNELLISEMARRLAAGRRATVVVELLPRLHFDLAGSAAAIGAVSSVCGQWAVPLPPAQIGAPPEGARGS